MFKIGDKVTYIKFGKVERGIVKDLSGDDYVLVVYHCAENWDRYFDYTGERTEISDLVPGWIEEKDIIRNEENKVTVIKMNVKTNTEFVLQDYLGDGVYGLFDGFGIWLHANDHKNPTDRIYLEPKVLKSLKGFAERCDELIKEKNRSSEGG